MAVVLDDRVVFARGFGFSDIETGMPVNPDTIFRIASTTKMLTAAALVSLSEQGKIKLDVPVGKYLQRLSPKLAQVTVHQLLSHTAGIRDGASLMSQVVKVGESIFNAGGQEFLLIPGTSGKAKYMHIAAHALRRM